MCASISGPDSGSSGTGGGRVLAAVAKPPPDPQPVPTKVTGRTKAGMRSPGRNDAWVGSPWVSGSSYRFARHRAPGADTRHGRLTAATVGPPPVPQPEPHAIAAGPPPIVIED